ncbi:MAG: tetratricopeptide repeat protein [Bacteroidales bacterium]
MNSKSKYFFNTIILTAIMILSVGMLAAQPAGKSFSRGGRSAALMQVDSARALSVSNPQKAFDHIEKALTLSGSSGDKLAEGLSYQVLGMINMNLSQVDLATGYLKKALNILDGIGADTAVQSTNYLLAEALAKQPDYNQASLYYKKVLAWAQKQGDPELETRVRTRMGELYAMQGDASQAIQMYEQVKQKEESRGNVNGVIAAQNKMGEVYQQSNQPARAISTLDDAEDLSRKTNNSSALKKTLSSKSSVLRGSGKYEEEKKVREELLNLSKEEKDLGGQAEQNLEIGNILIEQNKGASAIPYLEKSIQLSDQGGNLEGKGEGLKVLSTAYDKNRQYDKALNVYKEYVAVVDAIHRKKEKEIQENITLLTSLNRKLERLSLIERDFELTEKRLQLMEQEQLVNRKSLRAQRIFTWSLLAVLLGLSITSVFVYRGILQKRKANQILALQSLRGQMNPHFIFNSLNSVNSYISRNDERTANKYLTEFARLMRSVMDQSKHDFILLASELEILRLYLFLEHSRFSDKFDYELEIEDEAGIAELEIPPMLIQPYIENAIWHGLRYRESKGKLLVRMGRAGDVLLVAVEDNGIGRKKSLELKTAHQQEHVSTGMKNIETRLGLIRELFDLNIEVQIEDMDPAGETGTRVSLFIPLKTKLN